MMQKAILYGNGSTAAVLHVHLQRDTDIKVEAFTVDREVLREETLSGLAVVAFDEVVERFPPQDYAMMVAVGYVRLNQLRAERCAQAKQMGYRLFSYVSRKSSVWDGLTVGENCHIGDFVSIAPFCKLGEDVHLSTGVIVGHNVAIGEHCFIASGANIGGYATIEPFCFIGQNATIRNRIRIARSSVIGAGAVILKDTHEKGVYLAAQAEKLPIQSDEMNLG